MTATELVKNIKVGINIGNTLDAWKSDIPKDSKPEAWETSWGNPVITKELVKSMVSHGFNLIRIPTTWKEHIGEAPEYKIDDEWMKRVREVVDYAYDLGAYVILNIHHEDWNYPYYDNEKAACEKMRAIWTQIGTEFADYDEHLIFEGQNEPRKVGTPLEWNGGDEEGWAVVNATNKAFIDTIRGLGGKNADRKLMIPGYAANCQVGIKHVDIPNDGKTILSVHAYEPYNFALEKPGRELWNHDTEAIDRLMKDLDELYIKKGIPVIIGEFGAMNKHNEEERAEWVKYYISAAKKIGVPCAWWDNGFFETGDEFFGLFDRYNYTPVYTKVHAAIMDAI